MTRTNVFIVAALSSFVAGSAFAQTTTFDNRDAALDRFEDLQEDIEDDAERDIDDFGNVGRQLGFDGSVALRSTVSNGNTDSVDVGIGANLGYYDGANGFDMNMVLAYGETDGDKDENNVIYGLEYTRDINDRLYGYAQIQGTNDDFGSFENDTFVGVGLGYRIIDTNTRQWSVSAGPGYRWADLNDGSEIEEEAFSVSSNYSAALTDTVVITSDTDIISSSSDTVVYSDIAMSVAMSNSLALRTALATEYHSDPVPGDDDIDNTLGVSIVYSFN